jgi:hypothetical protein
LRQTSRYTMKSPTGNFPKWTPIKQAAFKIPYVWDFTTTLHRQQAEVIQSHEHKNIRNTEQGDAQYGKYNSIIAAPATELPL